MNRLIRVSSTTSASGDGGVAIMSPQRTNSISSLRPVMNRLQRVPSNAKLDVGLTRTSSTTSVIAMAANGMAAPRSTDPSASRSNLRLFRTPSQLSLANHPYALGSRSNSYAPTQPRQSLTRSASRTSVQPTARRPSGFMDVGTTESVFSVAQQMERTFPLPSRQQVTPGRVDSRTSLSTTRSNFSQSTLASSNQHASLGTEPASARREGFGPSHRFGHSTMSVRPSIEIATTESFYSAARRTGGRPPHPISQYVSPGRVGSSLSISTTRSNFSESLMASRNLVVSPTMALGTTDNSRERQSTLEPQQPAPTDNMAPIEEPAASFSEVQITSSTHSVSDPARSVAFVRPQIPAEVEVDATLRVQELAKSADDQEIEEYEERVSQPTFQEEEQITTSDASQSVATEDLQHCAPETSQVAEAVQPQTSQVHVGQTQTTQATVPVLSLTTAPEEWQASVEVQQQTMTPETSRATVAKQPQTTAPETSQAAVAEQPQTKGKGKGKGKAPEILQVAVEVQPQINESALEPSPSITLELSEGSLPQQPQTTEKITPLASAPENSGSNTDEQPKNMGNESPHSTAAMQQQAPPEQTQLMEESDAQEPTQSEDFPSCQAVLNETSVIGTERCNSETNRENNCSVSGSVAPDMEEEESEETSETIPTSSSADHALPTTTKNFGAKTSQRVAEIAVTENGRISPGCSGDASRSDATIVGEKRQLTHIIGSTDNDDDISILDEIPAPSKMPPPKKIPKRKTVKEKKTAPDPIPSTRMMTRSMRKRSNATLKEQESELRQTKSDDAMHKKSKRR